MTSYDWFVTLKEVDSAVPLSSRDFAGEYQQAFKSGLEKRGFSVRCEVPIEYRDDEKRKRGRIDLVAVLGDDRAAIELDFRSPRKRSILKVGQWATAYGGFGWVVLRDPAEMEVCYMLVSETFQPEGLMVLSKRGDVAVRGGLLR